MKLSIRTFCLICILSSGSTVPFEESEDRDFFLRPQIYYSHEASANRAFQTETNVTEVFKDQEISHELDEKGSQKINFKRHQSSYERNYPQEHYSRLNRNDPDTKRHEGTRIFRTYGRGKAEVTRQGQIVNVPNEFSRNGNREASNSTEKNENEIKPTRHRGVCRECPTDQTVIASKGNAFAILPEPCSVNPKMWNHVSGPRPGSKIQGVHTITGYMGHKKKFCQYNYQVIVQHCEPLEIKDDTTVECSAENYWGSICNVTCGNEKEPLGPTQLECKEDLTWSNPIPSCKSKTDCPNLKVKLKSCLTVDLKEVEGDFIPNGTTCKFRQNVSVNCKDGRWRFIRKNKGLSSKKIKKVEKSKIEKNDPCNPNPCQNGGTCLKPESNKGPPICKCRPQTGGVHCELRECYYNICENDGLCFFLNEERICYCPSEFSGDTCQNYTPQ